MSSIGTKLFYILRMHGFYSSDCPYPNFQCTNGLCVDYNYRCDGSNDCRDNSDEMNCSKFLIFLWLQIVTEVH